jgi:hypothetical protein
LRLHSATRDKGDPLELAGGRNLLRTFGTHRPSPGKSVALVMKWRARLKQRPMRSGLYRTLAAFVEIDRARLLFFRPRSAVPPAKGAQISHFS